MTPEAPRRRIADRMRDVSGIAVDRMGAAADRAAREHPDLLRMENLDTDLKPPPAAVEATQIALGRDDANSYLPFVGQDALRRAAAAHVSRLSGVAYDPNGQCLITAGGTNGCLVTLLALVNPGEEVILTDPTYVGMINRVRLAGGVSVLVPFQWMDGAWRLDTEALENAVSARTKAMFLMSPSMPSGGVLSRAEWECVAGICRKADLWLIYNAAMERILYDGQPYVHPAGLPGMAERTITVGSVSKEFRMIGWRVGWIVGPAAVLSDIGLAAISDVVTPVGIAQPGAAAALAAEDSETDLAAAVAEWKRRRDLMLEEMGDLPLRKAAGGWSMLLDAGVLGLTGAQASLQLLTKSRIAVTPMENWGIHNGRQFARFVFSNEPVERLKGIGERVRRALA